MSASNNVSASEKGRQIPIVCPGHTRPLAELEFCYVKDEDRTFLVSACHDKMPMLRDGSTGNWIGTFAGHKGAVWSCRLDPTGSLAATASGDFSVKVWDAITGKMLWHFTNHKHIVKTCDFSPNSKRLATGGHEGVVRIYDLANASQNNNQNDVPTMEIMYPTPSKVAISKCNWFTDNLLLVAYSDGNVRFWEVPETPPGAPAPAQPPKEPIHVLSTEQKTEIRDMELSFNLGGIAGNDILTVAAGQKVFFFDVNNKSLVHVYPMPVHFRDEGGATLHPSGKMFVAGGSDLWVRVFDYETGEELECHKGHHGPIRCVRYSPDGTIYASGSEDGTIRLWKTDPEASPAAAN